MTKVDEKVEEANVDTTQEKNTEAATKNESIDHSEEKVESQDTAAADTGENSDEATNAQTENAEEPDEKAGDDVAKEVTPVEDDTKAEVSENEAEAKDKDQIQDANDTTAVKDANRAADADTEKKAPKAEKVTEKEIKKTKEAKVSDKQKQSASTSSQSETDILNFDEPTEEFDWDNADKGGFGEEYNEKEKNEYEILYDDTLNTIVEKEVLKGTVVGVNDRDVILNIGFKSDGLVSASEFRDLPDLKVGDEVEVYIEEQENANGQLVLSRKKAKIVKAWERIQDGYENDKVIDGLVKRRTKGGLIMDIYGVEAFLPGSQIDVKPIRDFDVFVDKKMEVKVVKINYANDNVVVSHKVLIEKDLEAQKAEILNNLEKGQVLEGVIKNMTNFGVFIDLGGVDGLLHITDISWGRINHPEEVLNLDETVKIVVLDFDEDKKRISLGMKQLTEHPWDSLSKDIEVGSKVKGKIVNVADYGAFLEISSGVEGLIHVSEMSWSQHLRNPSDFLQVGDILDAVVLTLDREERKMSLGIKQLSDDPWTKSDVLTKYAVGTIHTGIIRNLTNFGLFIELEEGIDGLVHVSDLSWTRKIKHPSEFVKVGDDLEVKVLELDVDNRRLALGHKQLEDNPWDTFEEVFASGSVHKCTVVQLTEKGAILELPYGIEGFASKRHLVREDGSQIGEGESMDFRVLEFSRDDRRILLSHAATYREEKAETVKPKATQSSKKKPTAIDKINKGTEKDTLGDIEALSALKEQMETDDQPKSQPAKKEAAEKTEVKEATPESKTGAKPEIKTDGTDVKEEARSSEDPKSEAKPKAKAKTKAKTTSKAKVEGNDESPTAVEAQGEKKETKKKKATTAPKAAAKMPKKADDEKPTAKAGKKEDK